MRAILVLWLILCAATAGAQPTVGPQGSADEGLTPPPLTSATPEPPASAPAPRPSPPPEEEFILPTFPSTPAQEAARAEPPAARSPSPSSAPAQSSVVPTPPQPVSHPSFLNPAPDAPGPSMLEVVAVPVGAGLLVGLIGSRVTDDNSTLAKLMIGTAGVTFLSMVTAKLLMAPSREGSEPSARHSFQAEPVPVVLSAGRGHEGLAAGPGLLLRF